MNLRRTSLFVAAALVALAGPAAFAGPLGIVDNFSVPGLTDYTQTRVLDTATGVVTANLAFSDATGALVASYSGTPDQPEQVVLLRDDFNLGVGEKLLVDVAQPTSTVQMDFGIAISATKTPTSVANPTPLDTRNTFDWLAVYVRPSQDAVRVTSSIGGTVVTASHVVGVNELDVRSLFIQRLSATQYNVGFVNSSGVQTVNNGVTPITFTATNVGTALGFYADLRAAGGTGSTSLGPLDNLRIVPEPSSIAFMILGLMGVARMRRRQT